jgi:hypothetical protein
MCKSCLVGSGPGQQSALLWQSEQRNFSVTFGLGDHLYDGRLPEHGVVFRRLGPIWRNSITAVNFSSGLPDGIHIFKPQILIWVNFVGTCNVRCWYILWPFGLFYGHILYILWTIRILYAYLVYLYRFGMLCQEKSGNPGFRMNFHPKIVDKFPPKNEYCGH